MDWRLLVEVRIANIGIPLDNFFLAVFQFEEEEKFGLESWQTSVMCIMGELAGGGSLVCFPYAQLFYYRIYK